MIKVKGEPIEWRKPVTRALKEAVTKLDASVTKSGRPRVFVTAAEKQRAYRERKRARG